jgi:alkylation response protein AidB-like acyl-CoA dehydrogenase
MDRFELRRLDYSLSDDHVALQDAYKQFFKTHCSIETVRAAEPSGFDKDLWERLCAMGATTMALPESCGGDGATLVDLTLVAEEIGRSLAPVSWIDHVCAARLLGRWTPTPPAWPTANSSRGSTYRSTVRRVSG